MISREGPPRAVWRLVVWGVLTSLLVAGISLRPPSLLAFVDQRIYDVLLRSAHHQSVTGRGRPHHVGSPPAANAFLQQPLGLFQVVFAKKGPPMAIRAYQVPTTTC